MKFSSNVVGDSNDENSFPHKLLLTNTHVSRLGKAHRKIFGSDATNVMIWRTWSNEESSLLIKSISETIKNEAKDQRRGFCSMLLVTLGASLLRNLLIGKDTIRAGEKQVRISDATSSFNKI